MKTDQLSAFISKTKQTTFSFGLDGTKQMMTGGIFAFITIGKLKSISFSIVKKNDHIYYRLVRDMLETC